MSETEIKEKQLKTLSKYGTHNITVKEIFDGNLKGSTSIVNKTIESLQVGDYVKCSSKLTEKTYTTNINETGYTTTQTFSTNKNILWRVLSVDNGKIEIVATQNVLSNDSNTGLWLSGVKGYNNVESVLKNLCEELYNSTLGTARSIKVEDINKLTGYVPSNQNDSYDYIVAESISLYDTLIAETKQEDWQDGKDNYTKWYWFSSKCLNYIDEDYDDGIRIVSAGKIDWASVAHIGDDDGYYEEEYPSAFGVRPVITLNANTLINSGEGTPQNPYEL